MKQEESSKVQSLEEEIIEKKEQRLAIRKKITASNELYHKSNVVSMQSWEFQNLTAEILILTEEIEVLELKIKLKNK